MPIDVLMYMHKCIILKEKPVFSLYHFVQASGKKRSWQQTERKTLSGAAPVSSAKRIADAAQFMEAMGPVPPQSTPNTPGPVVMTLKNEECMERIDFLRRRLPIDIYIQSYEYMHTCTLIWCSS